MEEKPQRLLDIEAAEVSLVDEPAIRRTFIVTKRKSREDDMSQPNEAPVDETEKSEEEEEEKATDMEPDTSKADGESDEEKGAHEDEEEEEEKGEMTDGEDEEEEEEKAEGPMKHVMALMPMLSDLLEDDDTPDEMKKHISELMDAVSQKGDAEKAVAKMARQIAELKRMVKKSEGGEAPAADAGASADEADAAPAPATSSDAVSREEFMAFQATMAQTMGTLAENMTHISKSVSSIVPVAKGAGAEGQEGAGRSKPVEKSDGELFGNVLGTK